MKAVCTRDGLAVGTTRVAPGEIERMYRLMAQGLRTPEICAELGLARRVVSPCMAAVVESEEEGRREAERRRAVRERVERALQPAAPREGAGHGRRSGHDLGPDGSRLGAFLVAILGDVLLGGGLCLGGIGLLVAGAGGIDLSGLGAVGDVAALLLGGWCWG
jgi:hypothetical protein